MFIIYSFSLVKTRDSVHVLKTLLININCCIIISKEVLLFFNTNLNFVNSQTKFMKRVSCLTEMLWYEGNSSLVQPMFRSPLNYVVTRNQSQRGNFPEISTWLLLFIEQRDILPSRVGHSSSSPYKCSRLRSTSFPFLPYSARKHPLAISRRETYPSPLSRSYRSSQTPGSYSKVIKRDLDQQQVVFSRPLKERDRWRQENDVVTQQEKEKQTKTKTGAHV